MVSTMVSTIGLNDGLNDGFVEKQCRVISIYSRGLLTSQVAYILNVRGNDIAHCPVAMAYALVTSNGASFFIDNAKVSPEVLEEMKVKGWL